MNDAQRIELANAIPCKHALRKLLEQARSTVRVAATLRKAEALFEVPIVCLELPVHYDHAKMVRSITHYLTVDGYTVARAGPYLKITWSRPTKGNTKILGT